MTHRTRLPRRIGAIDPIRQIHSLPCRPASWSICWIHTRSFEAQAELTLNDAQYAQFVTRLKRLQEARRRNQRERNQILQDLRRLTGPLAPTPADETVVRERLKALRDHDERATVEMRKAYETLDEVLDVRQQARFRIFEETIERRKLDLVLRARERANRSGRGGQ